MPADGPKHYQQVARWAKLPWDQIRLDYEAGASKKGLEGYAKGLTLATIDTKARREGWDKPRRQAAIAARRIQQAAAIQVTPIHAALPAAPLPSTAAPVIERMERATVGLIQVVEKASAVADGHASKGIKEACEALDVAERASAVLKSLGENYARLAGIPIEGPAPAPGGVVVNNFSGTGALPDSREVVELMNVIPQGDRPALLGASSTGSTTQ